MELRGFKAAALPAPAQDALGHLLSSVLAIQPLGMCCPQGGHEQGVGAVCCRG